METTNDLQNIIELNIVNLFNKTQNDSWTIIIFQTLIWSFRRWAIHYLMSTDICVNLKDCVWDTHVDLVREFAPNELKDFGIIWLNPINIEHRGDIIEELNQYFMMIVDYIDKFIQNDNEDALNILACFLDDRLTELIDDWLSEKSQYRIYPKIDDSPDSFSVIRVHEIVHTIMNENKERFIPTETPVGPSVQFIPAGPPEAAGPSVQYIPPEPAGPSVYFIPPEPAAPSVQYIPPEPAEPAAPTVYFIPAEPAAPAVVPAQETVREAITHRRLTRKLRQRTLPMTRKKTHSL